jgi:predicted metal-binding membrane protein
MTGTRTAGTAAVLTATLALAAAAWVVAVHQMRGMDMGVATDLGSLQFFVAAWVSMMAAMMLPDALPALIRRARAGGSVLAVPQFAVSYLAVWTVVGLVAYALYYPHGTAIAGTLTVAAGLYELTPLKRACRLRCRQSVRSGSRFGLYCIGSSIGLMLVLLAVGVPLALTLVGLGIAIASRPR